MQVVTSVSPRTSQKEERERARISLRHSSMSSTFFSCCRAVRDCEFLILVARRDDIVIIAGVGNFCPFQISSQDSFRVQSCGRK